MRCSSYRRSQKQDLQPQETQPKPVLFACSIFEALVMFELFMPAYYSLECLQWLAAAMAKASGEVAATLRPAQARKPEPRCTRRAMPRKVVGILATRCSQFAGCERFWAPVPGPIGRSLGLGSTHGFVESYAWWRLHAGPSMATQK